ncbi:serine/threonine-protein kinase [Citricoccus sp.]|uniref:serine/threonine-protein kinase n=1 Tax=Micrococcaceae TaxID=1268 RepID=UPI0016072C28|nr:serine/threonine-protein kinase [Citricoccus sp.]MBB5748140.1 serine/threonine protein kinase [Micrococcus sp. TA1]HRO92528.1 protein kinase [Citricoccus sp.]
MSSKRPPAPPPQIAGYRYLSLLGSGGFSDVYLYEQDRPRRKVAVKVLLAGLRTERARQSFESEANLMAQLSSHPYIVTIYEADVTEDGHSYLAMEYCSRPSLDIRYRRSRLGVDEVLALGVQVSSAVETAHRAGIVHRDIKPANILTTDYNRPALTDFGISGTTDMLDEEAGMSIPWSAPEAFTGGSPDGVAMDVWSLGATLYTLLAGRSPFVRPGADNSQRELVSRIGRAPLPPLNRADLPASLELVLATAMAKNPASRFPSAHALALALQRVQSELGLSVTPFEVMDESGSLEAEDDAVEEGGEATRVRQVVSIDPDRGATDTSRLFPPMPPAAAPGRPAEDDVDDATVIRPGRGTRGHPGSTPAGTSAEDDPTIMGGRIGGGLAGARAPSRRYPQAGGEWEPDGTTAHRVEERSGASPAMAWATENRTGIIASLVVLVLGVAAAVWLAGSLSARPAPDTAPTLISESPALPLPEPERPVRAAEEVSGTRQGQDAVFTWTNPEPAQGDEYLWRTTTATGKGRITTAEKASATTPVLEQDRTCIEVVVVRANGKQSDPAVGCVE